MLQTSIISPLRKKEKSWKDANMGISWGNFPKLHEMRRDSDNAPVESREDPVQDSKPLREPKLPDITGSIANRIARNRKRSFMAGRTQWKVVTKLQRMQTEFL
jgi:hypothetical protein